MNFFVEYKNEFGTREEFNNFVELIKKIWGINEEAARKLTKADGYMFPSFWYSGDLTACFMWHKTSEGWEYWASIADVLDPIDDEEIEIEKEEINHENFG